MADYTLGTRQAGAVLECSMSTVSEFKRAGRWSVARMGLAQSG